MSQPYVSDGLLGAPQSGHFRSVASGTLTRVLFKVYIALVLILPTGNLMGVNVKYLLFIILFTIGLRSSLKRGIRLTELALLHVIPMIFLIGFATAILYGSSHLDFPVIQYTYMATTIVGCWLILMYVTSQDDVVAFVRLVILSMVFIASLKIAVIAYFLITGIPIVELMRIIGDFFHASLMSGSVESIGGRIQFVSDIILPTCIFALLFLRKRLALSISGTIVCLSLLTFSSLMSFTRFFWAQTLMAIVLGMTNLRRDIANSIFAALLISSGLYYSKPIELLLSERLSAAVAGGSDMDRISQLPALKTFALDAPFFGHGLGSYTNELVRVWDAPYNYELQVLALVGQIGLVGVFFLLGLLCVYCKNLFQMKRGQVWYRLCLITLLVTSIAGCFLNPYLFSSTAAIGYGLLVVLANLDTRPITVRSPNRPVQHLVSSFGLE